MGVALLSIIDPAHFLDGLSIIIYWNKKLRGK